MVSIDTSALGGDLVIVRSDGSPLYHFTVVVDDIAMAISHVVRGEDHLSNTPKHILLFRALGAEPPVFAHLPLILNPDRTKMSKRKSQTAVADYRAQGYVKEALVNHLALLGWSSGGDDDLFALEDLVDRFELERVQSSGAIFDAERLAWLNGQWIRMLPTDDLVERTLPFLVADVERAAAAGARTRSPTADDLAALMPIVRERLPRLDAVGPMLDFVFVDDIEPDLATLVPKRWDEATTATAPRGRRRRRSTGSASSRSRPTSSSQRFVRSPRSAAGSPATCSWPCASRSPDARRRPRCSTRWSPSGSDARSSACAPRRPG